MPATEEAMQKEMWPPQTFARAEYTDFLRPELYEIVGAPWWKNVGALLAFNGAILLAAFNSSRGVDLAEYLEGDLCGLELGQCVGSLEVMCPEAMIVGTAASGRTIMQGTDLFVQSFPCLPCACLCARTRIKRLFYRDGRPNAPEIEAFLSEGVEIFKITDGGFRDAA